MLRIAIVGAGGMGHHQTLKFSEMEDVEVVAVCDIDEERVQKIAAVVDAKPYTDLDELLENEKLDAVSNCTPDSLHKDVALKILAAGKHILSEKPLATNYRDAQDMVRAADKAGVVNMVNFSYRSAPAIQEAKKFVTAGGIGSVKHVEASYLQSWLVSRAWGDWRTSKDWLWRLSSGHGSQGALGDIGVHILDFAGFPVGSYKSIRCHLRTFDKAPGGELMGYRLDANDSAVITADFENGAVGVIHVSRWATGYQNSLRLQVFGDKGGLRLDLDASKDTIEVCTSDDVETFEWKTIVCDPARDNYERFRDAVLKDQPAEPDFARGAEIQQVLDACFESDRTGRFVDLT